MKIIKKVAVLILSILVQIIFFIPRLIIYLLRFIAFLLTLISKTISYAIKETEQELLMLNEQETNIKNHDGEA